ncbi:uncharacterized protein [Triticum aestivum]|uniref:uncharacterized protein n=1 Tax=Triticum aestivum TaxID=4565 RepID=UPI001D019ABB|nr:uncharacterized protein LOC123154459 [Triticum aestivum]
MRERRGVLTRPSRPRGETMRQDGSSLPDRTPMQMEAKHQRTLRRRRRVKLIPMIEEGNQSSVAGAFIIDDDVRHSRATATSKWRCYSSSLWSIHSGSWVYRKCNRIHYVCLQMVFILENWFILIWSFYLIDNLMAPGKLFTKEQENVQQKNVATHRVLVLSKDLFQVTIAE